MREVAHTSVTAPTEKLLKDGLHVIGHGAGVFIDDANAVAGAGEQNQALANVSGVDIKIGVVLVHQHNDFFECNRLPSPQ